MIVDIGGRYKLVETKEDEWEALQKLMESMSPEEQEAAHLMIKDGLQGFSSPIHTEASMALYHSKPVDMETFLTDPYFLGEVGKTLFPGVKKCLIEIFGLQKYTKVFWGGALGVGKSSAAAISILRMVYEISCIRDPQVSYGIAKSDVISFPCISVTEEAAERNLVEKIRGYMVESPYFQKEFVPIKNSVAAGIIFPNRIMIPPGVSTEAGALGSNPMGCAIDESNFFKRTRSFSGEDRLQNKSNIQIIYESMKRRIDSRFLKRGVLPGLIFVASSKRSVDSFTEKEIRMNADRKDIYVTEMAAWEAHPEGRYSKERFKVAVGSETQSSRILVAGEPDPEGMKVIEVPMDFYDSFEKDVDQSLRDIAGVSTVSITPFIARREKIIECIDPTMVHPFNQEVWDMALAGKIDFTKIAKQMPDGSWQPKHNPQAPRHVHLDLSKNQDSTGISIAHIAGFRTVQKNSGTEELAPVIHVDFMLKMRAPKAGEIKYAEVRRLIYEFSRHGFFIKLVTADQFQSLFLLQSLKSQGYNTHVVSVEPAGGPYEALKLALYENRMRMYNYNPVIKELRELQKNWKTGKVDHPENGEKDVSDTLAANVATLSKTAYGVTDQILTSDTVSIDEDERDVWVLDNPETIVIEEKPESSGPEWRKAAEQVIKEQGQSDWKSNFQLPFDMG